MVQKELSAAFQDRNRASKLTQAPTCGPLRKRALGKGKALSRGHLRCSGTCLLEKPAGPDLRPALQSCQTPKRILATQVLQEASQSWPGLGGRGQGRSWFCPPPAHEMETLWGRGTGDCVWTLGSSGLSSSNREWTRPAGTFSPDPAPQESLGPVASLPL